MNILQWPIAEHTMFPLLFIFGALLIGLVLNKVFFSKLRAHADRMPGSLYQNLVKSFKGMPILWSLMIGIYGAIYTIPMNDNQLVALEKSLLILILLSATIVSARIVVNLVGSYAKKAEGVFPTTSIFVNLAELLTYLIGTLIILQSIGISITPILTALGVGGLAVALALQDTLSNLFSGLHIIVAKPIKPGDYVKLSSGEEGYVRDITWRYTTIESLLNHMIIVPNAKIASANITNYSLPNMEVYLSIQIGVSYDSDLELVERISKEITRSVMREVKGGVADFEPIVRFHTFADSGINFNLGFRVTEFANQYMVKHELIKRIHAGFAHAGIQIPFPIRTVYWKEPN